MQCLARFFFCCFAALSEDLINFRQTLLPHLSALADRLQFSLKGQLTRTDTGVTLSKDGVLLGTYTQQGDLVTFTAPDGTARAALR